jgi:hypothetical protein
MKLSWFPNMHIQLPTRILYINGFKGLRHQLDLLRKDTITPLPSHFAIATACAPGVIMTPISSMLEACNATSNLDPLYRRWMHGKSD